MSNIAGWTTSRKIVIIESDDWGSIRMPSRKVFEHLVAKGIFKGDEPFNLYETLASGEDLEELFETLHSFKDINNNPCVFTAVCVVANPDFKKIKDHDFKEYFYEPFTDTLNRYYPNEKVFELWKEGIEERVFWPQFHGREHLNVAEWMRGLQQGDKETHLCFDNEVWVITRKNNNSTSISYQAPFDFYYPQDLAIQGAAIQEGLFLFKKLFGYKATFFVPPNGPFNTSLEKVAAESDIKYISVAKIQMEPIGYGKNKIKLHWLGQHNRHNQSYTTRNCIFEPIYKGKDWIDSCLSDIEIAFRWKKPAIISSHRASYIGGHDRDNRKNGLRQLRVLIGSILKKWPTAEFMTTDELGKMIDGVH